MTETQCPWDKRYTGGDLPLRQLAEIFMSSHLRGRSITDPAVHREMREGWAGGARPADDNHPCLMWDSRRDGIHYEVGHDGDWKILKWAALASTDPAQPGLFEGAGP